MADANSDNTYEVTIKVADPSDAVIFGTVGVRVEVTNVDELGALSGSTTASINEGDTDSLGTYSSRRSRMALEGTGMSRMLKFSSAPDYETPMGGANDDSNTYMVTVMASAGGEMEMVEVTVMVDNVEGGRNGNPEPDAAQRWHANNRKPGRLGHRRRHRLLAVGQRRRHGRDLRPT